MQNSSEFRPEFMAETTATFPVVLFDGEHEINIGNVLVYPSLDFEKFQSIISQRIGLSPQQISVSLISQMKSRSSSDSRRKIPITDKVNFSAILGEKDSYFLVVLKRSRRDRRGKLRHSQIVVQEDKSTPPEKMILRRDPAAKSPQLGLISPLYNQVTPPETLNAGRGLGLGILDYENQLWLNLQMQRQKYLISTNSYPYSELENGYNHRIPKGINACEVCAGAKGWPIPFHWCIYDAITEGFRSPAGPIERPSKP